MSSVETARARAQRLATKLADSCTLHAALDVPTDELALGERLDDAALARLAARFGAPLPEEYRAFAELVGTSGAGPDGGLLGAEVALPFEETDEEAAARCQRPFRLTAAWHPLQDDGSAAPLPFDVTDATLYDGILPLTDLGDGCFAFLVMHGTHAGEVWEDRCADGGGLEPVAPLLDWYEAWLDELLVDALMEHLRRAMPPGQTSPVHDLLERWGPLLDERAERPEATAADLAARALWKLAQGRAAEADAIIARLERHAAGQVDEVPLPDGASETWLEEMLESLTLWSLADDAADALDRHPPAERLMMHKAWRIRRLLAQNPHTPALALSWLGGDGRLEVRCAVAQNPGASPKVLDEALAAATTLWGARVDHVEALFVLDLLARHPAWPLARLRELARWDERWPSHGSAPWVVRAVAANPAADAALLDELAQSSHACVRHAAAHRAELPAARVTALAADADGAVREAAAQHPALPAAAMRALATDPRERVRAQLARRTDLPPEVQRVLARDLTTPVVLALGEQPSLDERAAELLAARPPVILPREADELAYDGTYEAELLAPEDRQAAPHQEPALVELAPGWPWRRRAPDETERAPTAAVATLVTWRALAHPGMPAPLLAPAITEATAENADELADLAGRAAAEHPWLGEAAMLALVRARYVPTRAHLAARPDATTAVLAALEEDAAPLVQRHLAERAASGPARTTLERWALSAQAETRAAAAACAQAPGEVLARLAEDAEPYVRCALAQNPACPESLLARLARDPDPGVRCAVLWRDGVSPGILEQLLADPTPEARAWATWARARAEGL